MCFVINILFFSFENMFKFSGKKSNSQVTSGAKFFHINNFTHFDKIINNFSKKQSLHNKHLKNKRKTSYVFFLI